MGKERGKGKEGEKMRERKDKVDSHQVLMEISGKYISFIARTQYSPAASRLSA